MSLFKPMRGLSTNFSLDFEKFPFKDGQIYLTPDDEKLYVDSLCKTTTGEEQKRILINKQSSVNVDYNDDEEQLEFL